jgi:uncharacterized membrane protein
MKTVKTVAAISIPFLIISTIGFLNTVFCIITCVGIYCMAVSLRQSSIQTGRDLDEIERQEIEEEHALQDTIDEVDAFLKESINRRQNRLVLIDKEKKD